MQDPLKVTLPPWRRGDGKPCDATAEYRVRSCVTGTRWTQVVRKTDSFEQHLDYAGPIEFIETEPEPEPLTLEEHETRVDMAWKNCWVVRAVDPQGIASSITVVHKDKRLAVEAFNAAVRAMEGK